MAKKTFKESISPAMQFITPPEGEATRKEGIGFPDVPMPTAEELFPQMPQPTGTGKPPEGYKLNPLYIETRSKRLQLLVQPSLLEKIKARAKANGTSLNDCIHSILEEATREEQ